MTTNQTKPTSEPQDETGAEPDVMPEAAAEASPADAGRQRLEDENAQLKDRLIRTLAEMENLRKRTEREVADARVYAVTGFARDLLTVADNMDRALAAVPTEGRTDVVAALVEGVDLTARELLKVFERHGIKRIAAEGERFDPHRHQAMFEVEDASVPAGTVVKVVQDGYSIGERALRPAFVGVAKGGAKPQRPTAVADATGEERPGGTVDRSV
jgi:molecular chaperone GrpE